MSEPRTVLITGSTSGVGLAAARRLVDAGHRVILHGRSQDKLDAAVATVKSQNSAAPVDSVIADLGSLSSVRAMADEVTKRFPQLDVLVNNAAISNWGRDERRTTVDGNELIFGTNYLSHYLLTRLLLPALLARRAPRVVSVGARQMGARFDFDDLDMQRDYKPMQAVLRAKLGLFCLTRELAASCLDPGLVDTPYQQGSSWVLRAALRVFGSSPDQVAELYEWLAISGDVSPEGRMYASPGKPVKWHAYVANDANTKRIWEASAEKVGLGP
jgi:NAD(P)-dependent dehydrogenase (short-subunit alcohol dehydrogenase family)